jgi:hypothetical protein
VSIIPLFLIFNFALAEYPDRLMISAVMTHHPPHCQASYVTHRA